MTGGRDTGFELYVAAKQGPLLRYAYVLCGNWHRAEDATAVALSKLYIQWPRIRRAGSEDAYARTVLRRVLIDDSRRPWRREEPMDAPQFHDRAPTEIAYEDRASLMDALLLLPLKQRQCLALRYWLDLSVDDTADELGISASAVKTHTQRGLERLRSSLTNAGVTP